MYVKNCIFTPTCYYSRHPATRITMGLFSAKKEIGPDTMLQRKSGLLFNEIDGEVVMLSIENSEYYGMDKVGSRIWHLLEKPMRLRELVSALMEEFEVTEEQCTTDTIAFLKKITDKKLIDLDLTPSPSPREEGSGT